MDIPVRLRAKETTDCTDITDKKESIRGIRVIRGSLASRRTRMSILLLTIGELRAEQFVIDLTRAQ